jgi:site-specific recombinase XerD
MHLYKRKNGFFYIRYKSTNNSWQHYSTKTKKQTEAKEIFIEFVKTFSPTLSLNKNSTFDSFSKEYLEYSKVNHSPSNTTRINYVINHFKNFIGHTLLSDVSNKVVEEYKNKRSSQRKPTTVNIELRALKSMFNTAVKWELIDKNPFKGVQLLRVTKGYPKYLTKEEVDLLCESTRMDWLRYIILLAFNTGMRRNELINLKWEDVNLKEKNLIVRNGEFFNTKNKKDRYIPLSKAIIKLLKKLPKLSEYVLTNENSKQLYPNYVTQCFRDLKSDCGINKDVSFHSLRHSFASMLVSKGVSLYVVKELLGHSDFATTQIYAHLESKSLKDAIGRLNV